MSLSVEATKVKKKTTTTQKLVANTVNESPDDRWRTKHLQKNRPL